MNVFIKDPENIVAARMDLTKGGQNGSLPDFENFESSAGYPQQKVMATLLAYPTLFDYLPPEEKNYWKATLKRLIEIMPRSIDGLDATVTPEFNDVVIGNAGGIMQQVSGAKRANSVPSYIWDEVANASINKIWTEYIRLFMWDVDLGYPAIVTYPDFPEGKVILPKDKSFTVLYTEPDESRKFPVKAYLITNHMPMSGGEWKSKRETGGNVEQTEVPIEFTGYQMVGDVVNQMSRHILETIDLEGNAPIKLKAFAHVQANVDHNDGAGVNPGLQQVEGDREKVNSIAEQLSS